MGGQRGPYPIALILKASRRVIGRNARRAAVARRALVSCFGAASQRSRLMKSK